MKASGVQSSGLQGTERDTVVPSPASVNSVAVWEVPRAGGGRRRVPLVWANGSEFGRAAVEGALRPQVARLACRICSTWGFGVTVEDGLM